MKAHDFNKYLRRNPLLCRIESVDGAIDGFSHAVIIPVLNESATLPLLLSQIATLRPEKLLVLIVVNNGVNAERAWIDDNQSLLNRFRAGENFGLEKLAWIDASSPGKELIYGVGEARKIGMDALLHRLGSSFECEKNIFFSLDADTMIKRDYFTGSLAIFEQNPSYGALAFELHHQQGVDEAEECAIRRYEAYLDSYRDGLASAGSPYAFKTVGSAFAVRASGYIQSGGMRLRHAGEDFYFLQAAAKSVGVRYTPEITVHPSARVSRRVPFGTGPMVAELIAGADPDFFPASVFDRLQALLTLANNPDNLNSVEFFLSRCPHADAEFLKHNNFPTIWPQVVTHTRKAQLPLMFHNWFDGLKTLQYLKMVRAQSLPSQN